MVKGRACIGPVAPYDPHVARILIIEDDAATADEIAAELLSHGHQTEHAGDGPTGLARATQGGFDAITLDRLLPGLDGLSLVESLRAEAIRTPVLMISALSDVDERIAGLRAGGDDYMVKPFASSEMAMRVEALLRRGGIVEETALRQGRLELDVIRRQVRIDGVAIRLMHIEYRLLEFFVRNAGQVLSRRLIFEKVWNYYFDPGANLINVHIARLRKKLDRAGEQSWITTIKGEGYRFDAVG